MPPLPTSLNKMIKPRFQLLIEAEPQADDPDGNRRLRFALKAMLRRLGLRCVTITPAETQNTQPNQERHERQD
ncbi:hypothetical protein PLANPX_5312 [Lacipirellula parvula]|uniref:Uncharacterized protein n=1 Tax=Lacipirellula parvula TaxID=2650471 RepID=A0A5K7XFV8_9BACT|nr:hypothetical protein PLANPX_5312 [Lacipirellula parvula]